MGREREKETETDTHTHIHTRARARVKLPDFPVLYSFCCMKQYHGETSHSISVTTVERNAVVSQQNSKQKTKTSMVNWLT